MIHDALVNLAGYVATEPKFRKVAGDTSSAKLRVAYTARRRDKETGDWTDGPTSFVNVQCWRTLADNVHMSVHKGEPVLVMGRLQIRRFEDAEGAQRTAVEIEATSIGHDLTRGVATFSRTRWPAAATAGETASPEAGAGPGEGARPGDADFTAGPERDGRSALSASTPDGDGIIDESAVAEFAREFTKSPGLGAAAGVADISGEPETDARVAVPA